MNKMVSSPAPSPEPPFGPLPKADTFFLNGAVFLIPFISWGNPPWLLGLFVILVAGIFVTRIRAAVAGKSFSFATPPLWLPFTLALLISIVHLLRSPVPYSSILFLVQLALALVFYHILSSERGTAQAVYIVLVWVVILVSWVGFQFIVLGVRPPSGPFLNPNYLATVLLSSLAYLLGSLMVDRVASRNKIVLLLAALSCSGALMMIGSRSAGLGMIMLWIAYLVFGTGRSRLIAVLVIGAIILAPNMIRHRVTDGYKGDPHSFSRVQIWKAALKMGADHPLLGVGPNLFYEHGPLYAFAMDELPVRYGRIVRKPHNEYLRSWAEGGVAGVFATGLFLLVVVCQILRNWRNGMRAPPLAVSAVLFQAGFHDITEVFSLMVLMLWWLAQMPPGEEKTFNIGRGPVGVMVASGIVILCFSFWLNLDLASRSLWLKGQRLIDSDIQGAMRNVRTATVLNPLLPGAARDLGRIRLMMSGRISNEQEFNRVMAAILRAQSLNRLDTVPLRLEAGLYVNAARAGKMKDSEAFALAAGKLKEASYIEPHNALIRLNLSEMYWDLNQRNRALDVVEGALEEEPNFLEAHRTRVSWLGKLDPGRVAWAQGELAKALERAAGYKPQSNYEEIILR